MKIFILFFALLLALSPLDAAVTPFHGMAGLGPQPTNPQNPNLLAHSFVDVDFFGRTTRLNYTGELGERVHTLSGLGSSATVSLCNATTIIISMPLTQVSLFLVGDYLSGDTPGICTDINGKATVMQRRIAGISILANQSTTTTVVFSTVSAAFHEFYKNLALHFSTNNFNSSDFQKMTPSSTRRGWFGDVIGDVEDAAGDVVDAVSDAAQAVATVATAVATGALSNSESFTLATFDYNGGPNDITNPSILLSSGSATAQPDGASLIDGDSSSNAPDASFSVTCNNCYAQSSLELDIQLAVSDYTLQVFAISLSGSASMNLEISIVGDAGFNYEGEFDIGTIPGPSLSFYVGIPITIDSSLPLKASWQASGSASLTATATAQGNANVNYGVQYMKSAWTPIAGSSFSFSSHLPSFVGTGSATATVQISPSLVLKADDTLTATLTLSPYVSVSTNLNTNDGCAIDVVPTYGVQMTLGAGIEIPLTDNTLTSYTSHPFQLYGPNNFGSAPYCIGASSREYEQPAFVPKRGADSSRSLLGTTTFSPPFLVCNASASTSCNNNGYLDCVTGVCNCGTGWTGANCGTQMRQYVSSSAGPSPSVAVNSKALLGYCPSGSCTVVTGLVQCPHLNGQQVCSPAIGIAAAEGVVASTLASLASIGSTCVTQARLYACSLQFPTCQNSATAKMLPMCFSECLSTMQMCDVPASNATAFCNSGTTSKNYSAIATSDITPQQDPSAPSCITLQASTRSCELATNLQTCTHLNGRYVVVNSLGLATPQAADAFVGTLVSSETSLTQECAEAATMYRCSQYLQVCGANQDPNHPILLSASVCQQMLAPCTSYATKLCSSNSSIWVADAVAPLQFDAVYSLQASDLSPAVAARLNGSNKLSTGAIAGITVGAVAFVAAVVGVGVGVWKRKRVASNPNIVVEMDSIESRVA